MGGSALFDADNLTESQQEALAGIKFDKTIIPNIKPVYLLVKEKSKNGTFYSPTAEQFVKNYIYEKLKNTNIEDEAIAKKFNVPTAVALEDNKFIGGIDQVKYQETKTLYESLSAAFMLLPGGFIISDAIDLGLAAYSYSQGDYWGASTGVLVAIPVAGDIAKTLKLPWGKVFGNISKRVNDWFSFGKKAKTLNINAVDEVAKKFNTKDKKQVENFIDAKGDDFKLPDNDDGWKKLKDEFDEWSDLSKGHNGILGLSASKSENEIIWTLKREGNETVHKATLGKEGYVDLDIRLPSEARGEGIGIKMLDESLEHFGGRVKGIEANWTMHPDYPGNQSLGLKQFWQSYELYEGTLSGKNLWEKAVKDTKLWKLAEERGFTKIHFPYTPEREEVIVFFLKE